MSHDHKGITDKDFELAKKIEEVVQWQPASKAARSRARPRTTCASPTSSTTRPRPEPRRADCRARPAGLRSVPDNLPGGKRAGGAPHGVPRRGLPVLLACAVTISRSRPTARRCGWWAPPCPSPSASSSARRPPPGPRSSMARPRPSMRPSPMRPTCCASSSLPLFGGLGHRCRGHARRFWRWPSGPAASSTMPARAGCWPIVRAMQDGGWVTATLAEVRNRADLVLFVGTDAQADGAPLRRALPRTDRDTLFGPLRRELVYLGSGLQPPPHRCRASSPCPADRAWRRRSRPCARSVAGAPAARAQRWPDCRSADLQALADRLRPASYAVDRLGGAATCPAAIPTC